MPRTKHIDQILKRLPHQPGVYQHFDVNGRLLYVGKAKDLKKRVTSYFSKQLHENGKTRLLVSKITDIQWLVTSTESDALLLENSLIKEHKPFYNILLKDDKTYPFIVIKKEPFPRIFATRQLIKDGSEYFGPFPSVKTMHTVLELCRKLYPIRTCALALTDENIQGGKFRVCLEYHIGNCLGPCVGHQTTADYEESIAAIRFLLKGNLTKVVKLLEEQMHVAAGDFRFEDADRFKRRMQSVKKFQAKNTIVHPTITDVDVFSIVQDARCAYVNFLKVQNGSVMQGHTAEVKRKLGEENREVLEAAIVQMRDRFQSESKTIFTPFPVDLALPNVTWHVPQRGDKHRLVQLSERNAKFYMRDRQKHLEQTNPEAAVIRLLETAQEDLRLTSLPIHIECFDNSNIQGAHPASACVVFKNGKPAKDDYRKFNIKTVVGPDDFASMREVVYRRYKHLKEQDESMPQLIIIDGGKGQLSHALEALEELGLRGEIAIIGIAKRLEEIFYPGDSLPLYIDKRSSTLKLIQQLRNEAHRFSLAHHRNLRSKAALRSELDDIPGVGPATRHKLLSHFKTVAAIRKATQEELKVVVNTGVVKKIQDFFQSSPPKK
ncbi:MAG: excinuclease ABC subunit UvrC [Flavobacteriales bacterium]|nr:excinuclease ABC subunit UvrC [Flavobacteriales bacterium]